MPSSSRARLFAAVVAVLAVGALARAASDAREQRVKAFRDRAKAEREKLKLDPVALRLQYPTPQVLLARPLPLEPGKTTPVSVSGKFQQGTLFVVDADDVQVEREELAAGAWKARLGVKKGALPQTVRLSVYSPVSAIYTSSSAFVVAGRYDCQVQLQRGLAARLVAQASDPFRYDVTWTRPPAATPLRKAVAQMDVTYGGLAFELPGDQAELMAAMQKSQQPGGAQAQMMAEMEKCQKLPQAEMIKCFQVAGERIKTLQAKEAEDSVAGGPACGHFDLSRNRQSGELEGGTFRSCLSNYEDRVAKARCTPIE